MEKKALEELKKSLSKKVKSNFKYEKDFEIDKLGLTELEFIMVLVDIEERTKIEFKPEEILNIKTIEDIVNLIERKL